MAACADTAGTGRGLELEGLRADATAPSTGDDAVGGAATAVDAAGDTGSCDGTVATASGAGAGAPLHVMNRPPPGSTQSDEVKSQ